MEQKLTTISLMKTTAFSGKDTFNALAVVNKDAHFFTTVINHTSVYYKIYIKSLGSRTSVYVSG